MSAPVRQAATPADAAVAGRLLHDFNVEFDEPAPPPEWLAERVTRLVAGGDTLVLLAGAAPGADAVAVLRFREALWSDGLECYLAELYVTPRQRRRGTGRTLLEGCMRTARSRGARSMEIGVDEPDLPARHLYESAGFTNRVGGVAGGPVMFVYEREL